MERERIVSSSVLRLTVHAFRSLTCSKMPCYGAVIFDQGKAKAERELLDMVSLNLSRNLQSRVRRELWRHD